MPTAQVAQMEVKDKNEQRFYPVPDVVCSISEEVSSCYSFVHYISMDALCVNVLPVLTTATLALELIAMQEIVVFFLTEFCSRKVAKLISFHSLDVQVMLWSWMFLQHALFPIFPSESDIVLWFYSYWTFSRYPHANSPPAKL